jgi:hypothetical protein
MADDPDIQLQERRRRHGPRRLLQALSSPDSYGLVLLLILVTYALSAAITAAWAVSLVLFVQIATIWVTLQASQAHRHLRRVTGAILVVTAIAAILNLFISRETAGGVMAVISGLLYAVAPVIIRRLVLRRTVDTQTVLGAIAAYLMVGMGFAFAYRALGALQAGPFFGSQGEGPFPQYLFFSFTTLTTTGYGNLVPDANPGQTLAVLEMLIGQLFLVTAVARVVSAWQPAPGRGRSPTEPDSN